MSTMTPPNGASPNGIAINGAPTRRPTRAAQTEPSAKAPRPGSAL